jgi:hypothetical protein
MRIMVRPGDVYRLPIPGDNGETKSRFCVILDSYPTQSGAQVVSIVFGCSETKRGARVGEFIRVEREPLSAFRGLGLENATTFHQEDIRHYDALSPRFDRRCGYCPPGLMLEFRKLSAARDRQRTPIPLLPDKAREEAEQNSREWQALQSGEADRQPAVKSLRVVAANEEPEG